MLAKLLGFSKPNNLSTKVTLKLPSASRSSMTAVRRLSISSTKLPTIAEDSEKVERVIARRSSKTSIASSTGFENQKSITELCFGTAGIAKNPRETLPEICKVDCGEDAYFISNLQDFQSFGVCDGVGGWSDLGVDPSLFAWDLMNCCSEAAEAQPIPIPQIVLEQAYARVLEKKEVLAGSGTACVLTLDKLTGTLYSSNLGDSGYIVIRDGKIIHQATELQHYFNAPYQLSVIPEEMRDDKNITDSPKDAIQDSEQMQNGDLIIVATDGLWDNVYPLELLTLVEREMQNLPEIHSASTERIDQLMSSMADRIATETKNLASQPRRFSPFAQNARTHGRLFLGGKIDDITVICAYVRQKKF